MILNVKVPKEIFQNNGKNKDVNITGFKLKNFIFGKNGTGKSTIANKIKEQYENTYDVRVFQGYRQIIKEDEGLSAIALGKKNAKLQPEIDKKKSEISELKKEKEAANINLKTSKAAHKNENDEIENFYTSAASRIKQKYHSWIMLNYDKRNFKEDKNNLVKDIENNKVKNYSLLILSESRAEKLKNCLNQKAMRKHDSKPIIFRK